MREEIRVFGEIFKPEKFFAGDSVHRIRHTIEPGSVESTVRAQNYALLRRMRQPLRYRRGVEVLFLVVRPEADDKITLLNLGSIYFVDLFVPVKLTVPHGCTIVVNRLLDPAIFIAHV